MGYNLIMENKLGLGISPDTVTYLFIGESEGEMGTSPWYKYDFENDRQIAIPEDALTGYLTSLVVVRKTFKDKTNYKLNIHISADHKYVIRTGVGTTFSRGLILSLKKLVETASPEVFSQPITLSVKRGSEDSKTAFCSIFHNSEKVFPDWDGEISLAPLIADLQKALGQVVQTREMMDDPDLYYKATVTAKAEAKTQPQKKPSTKTGGKRNGKT